MTTTNRMPLSFHVVAIALAGWACCSAAQDEPSRKHLLVTRSLEVLPVRLVEIADETITVRDSEGVYTSLQLADCLGVIDTEAVIKRPGSGLLILANGERFYGAAITGSAAEQDALLWRHAGFGRLKVPMGRIESIILDRTVGPPDPGDADIVQLTNGDTLEGFVTQLGDPVSIDIDGSEVTIPLDRVAAIRLITPAAKSRHRGCRVWLINGTVVDVDRVRLGDDGYVHLFRPSIAPEIVEQEHELVRSIAGLLFDPSSLVPLSSLTPVEVRGPPGRYQVPEPVTMDDFAPLGLARISLNGPLVVRYRIPEGVTRFAAEAVLPPDARRWGDYEVIVRDDDREVFRAHLDETNTSATINVALVGSELTIELTEGRHGPILDRLILVRAMLGRTDPD